MKASVPVLTTTLALRLRSGTTGHCSLRRHFGQVSASELTEYLQNVHRVRAWADEERQNTASRIASTRCAGLTDGSNDVHLVRIGAKKADNLCLFIK